MAPKRFMNNSSLLMEGLGVDCLDRKLRLTLHGVGISIL